MAKKKLYSEIVVVIDKSGSMYSMQSDTIGGFNKFLSEQKAVPGKANLTLVQFNHLYHFTFKGVDIQEVPELTDKTYYPEGSTALLDAVGRAIIETDRRIGESKKKPDQVIFVIITDGYENSSSEFNRSQIATMVKEKQDLKWDFVFMGANIDSFGDSGGGGLGFAKASTANYSSGNVKGAYDTLSKRMVSYRSKEDTLDFSEEDRQNLMADEETENEK